MAAGGVALGLIVTLCLLIAPRSAPRESMPPIRNAAVLPATDTSVGASVAIGSTDDGRPLISLGRLDPGKGRANAGDSRVLVVYDGDMANTPSLVDATLDDGRRVSLRLFDIDITTGLTAYVSNVPDDFDSTPISFSDAIPPTGTNVTVDDHVVTSAKHRSLRMQVGATTAADDAIFVPLSDMVSSLTGNNGLNLAPGSAVFDSRDRLIGLFTRRDGAIGFIPGTSVTDFILQLD